MRNLSAIFLTIVISYSAFYNAGLSVYWLLNRAYIASTLCENRDKPEMHCNGVCYLEKRIPGTESQNKSQLPAPVLKKGLEIGESCFEIPAIFVHLKERAILETQPVYEHQQFPNAPRSDIFQPPQSAA